MDSNKTCKIYFIIENEDLIDPLIKIGFSNEPSNRLRQLQTGNPRILALMGWINADKTYEKRLHEKYHDRNTSGEWFKIHPTDVLEELKNAGTNGFLARQKNIGDFLGCDQDGIPEYLGPWEWSDIDFSEFCPECGCSCGLDYNENYGGERCLNCGYPVF